MKILSALGWGLFFLIVRNVMPEVFSGFIHTLTLFFTVLEKGLNSAQAMNNIGL